MVKCYKVGKEIHEQVSHPQKKVLKLKVESEEEFKDKIKHFCKNQNLLDADSFSLVQYLTRIARGQKVAAKVK